jgi:hypothetical protein
MAMRAFRMAMRAFRMAMRAFRMAMRAAQHRFAVLSMEFCALRSQTALRFENGVLREAQNSGNNCRMAAIVQTPAGYPSMNTSLDTSVEFCAAKLHAQTA